MTCDTIRQRLLGSERPDKPTHAEANHLANCSACRAWLRRLTRLEEMLPLLPVPPSAPPPPLLALFQTDGSRPLVTPAQRLPSFRPKREGGRQKLALALSMAATLTLFAIGWWAWPHGQKAAEQTHVEKSYPELVKKCLEPARTDRERVYALTDLADKFLDTARKQPNRPAAVERQAGHFRRLLENELLNEARGVSPGDRIQIISSVAGRLAAAREKAGRLAAAWQSRYPDSAKSLLEMADDAAKAENRLRAMIRA